MFGMGFLRLKKVLERHKWSPSLGHEEIERARRKEELLLRGAVLVLIVLFFLLVLGIVFSEPTVF